MTEQQPWLLAEDLLLLVLDTDRGTPSVSIDLNLAVAGALLIDLMDVGLVTVVAKQGVLGVPRVTRNEGVASTDETLRAAFDELSAKPVAVFATLTDLRTISKQDARHVIVERLTERGVVKHRTRRVFVFFRRSEWPAVDAARATELHASMEAVLRGERAPTEREATLVALLHAFRQVRGLTNAKGAERKALMERTEAIVQQGGLSSRVRAITRALSQMAAASAAAFPG